MTFFYKARAWVALSLSLRRKKVQASVGLNNELAMTPYRAQQVGLRVF